MKLSEQYRAIAETIVTSYKTDIDIDCKLLDAERADQIIFGIGDCGTYAVELLPADGYPAYGISVPYLFATADRNHILDQNKVMIDCITDPRNTARRYFLADQNKQTVREISADKARDLVGDYISAIRRQWAAEKIAA